MILNAYIDAFNLYYGSLYQTAYKWLNLDALCRAYFPSDQFQRIRYFTARVRASPHDPQKPMRQDVYLRALRTLPHLEIHEGQYIRSVVKMPEHPLPPPPGQPNYVRVVKNEEKGSDVNLATHLLVDAASHDFEGAVIVTNDSDLALPIQLVRTAFKRKVFVLHTCSRPNRGPSIALRAAAGLRGNNPPLVIQDAVLATCQFPASMTDANGTIHKPPSW